MYMQLFPYRFTVTTSESSSGKSGDGRISANTDNVYLIPHRMQFKFKESFFPYFEGVYNNNFY